MFFWSSGTWPLSALRVTGGDFKTPDAQVALKPNYIRISRTEPTHQSFLKLEWHVDYLVCWLLERRFPNYAKQALTLCTKWMISHDTLKWLLGWVKYKFTEKHGWIQSSFRPFVFSQWLILSVTATLGLGASDLDLRGAWSRAAVMSPDFHQD